MPFIDRRSKSRPHRRKISARVKEEIGFIVERHGDGALAKVESQLADPALSPRQRKFLEAVRRALAAPRPVPLSARLSSLGAHLRSLVGALKRSRPHKAAPAD
jgi:hypothetical protein